MANPNKEAARSGEYVLEKLADRSDDEILSKSEVEELIASAFDGNPVIRSPHVRSMTVADLKVVARLMVEIGSKGLLNA